MGTHRGKTTKLKPLTDKRKKTYTSDANYNRDANVPIVDKHTLPVETCLGKGSVKVGIHRGDGRPNNLCVLKLLSGSLLSLNSLLICIFVFEGYYFDNELSVVKDAFVAKTNFIIPCDDMSLSPDEDDDTFDVTQAGFQYFVDDTGKSICSFQNLTAVIEKKTERDWRIRLAKGLSVSRHLSCGNVKMAPAPGYRTAYFTGLLNSQIHTDRGSFNLIHWDQAQSYIGAGIAYHNGKIRVNSMQYYFVYAFVTFNQEIVTDTKVHHGSCLFTLYVMKGDARYDGEFERIEIQSTQMLRNDTHGTSTIYVGSHVHLYSDEELYVKVTDAKRLANTTAGNGFGIFPLT